MSDPFLVAEAGIETSQPREYCTITHGTTSYNIAFADRDLVVGGTIYTAIPAARGEIGVNTSEEATELSLTFPIDHAFPNRYALNGIPPRQVSVTVWRQQGSLSEQIWSGQVTSMAVDDNCTEATFRVESKSAQMMRRMLPTISTGRRCPWFLYSTECGVDRAGSNPDGVPYKCTTTVIFVSGRDVRVDLSNVPAGNANRATWAQLGELVHTASGERMTIAVQKDPNPGISTVADLTLQTQIPGMNIGDSVDVYAGCAHTVAVCKAKFGNVVNFGGTPNMPSSKPFRLNGFGIYKV